MDSDLIFGPIVIFVVIGLLTYFTLVARRRINKIKETGTKSARTIIRNLKNE